ncbi:hypothetical protein Q764_13740 [Flavobacterium suncheonense GH29-5 = DSM 17707]|uniref:DUF6705 domain-containing protein n=2 Tax=Flavobacterium suncheonense TaxID=350894 RepID=A0A0A2M462_9FLAO|nr:hypothetical protein Q764_13740 [Flavobacterium suncheonense GH29-5 = DSM 17707]
MSFSCKAQVVPLNTYYDDASTGAYFKDTFDEMNKFVGTWKFTSGNTTLTITLEKKENVFDGEFYEDLLIGEYKYVKNGIELINTLPVLNDPSITGRYHNISGRQIIPNNIFVLCNDCTQNERRFKLHFNDPQRDYLSVSIILRYLLNESNPNKMTVTVFANDGVMLPYNGAPTEPRVPYGEYLMIKQ